MAFLENRYFHVLNEKRTGSFSFISKLKDGISLIDNNMAVLGEYASGEQFHFEIKLSQSFIPISHKSAQSKFSKYSGVDEKSKIEWDIDFKLSEKHPIVLWRLSIKNLSNLPIFIHKLVLLKPISRDLSNLDFGSHVRPGNLRFYSHGWQSWSYSGVYSASDRMRRSRLGILQEPMVINPGTPSFTRKGEFSSDFFAVVGDAFSRQGFVIGFLSQCQHFGTVTAILNDHPQIQVWANGDKTRLNQMDSMTTDWAVLSICNLDDSNSLSTYLDAVAEHHAIETISQPETGWCSWYYYYQDISQSVIEKNLDVINNMHNEVPLHLIQIDDGYQREVGDWFEFTQKFPSGVKKIANKIKLSGFTPGIWTAPFILHPKSKTVKDHPEWLLRRRDKHPARAGFVWNSLGMALDLTAPGTLDHVRNIIGTAVNEWGFQYLKLDFLYAAALKGKYYDDTKTRAQVLRMGLEVIRAAAGPKTTLLGCGVPIASALGLVDCMRIGPDVNSHWKPTYFNISFPFKKEPHMTSAENSINNILTRSFFHNRWWVNDPDCLLVRENSALTLEEIQTLATLIALTGGAVLVSDNMAALSKDRLQIVKALLPPINQQVQVIDWMQPGKPERLRLDLAGAVGEWNLLSYSNWEESPISTELLPAQYDLPEAEYIVDSFWDSKVRLCQKNQPLFKDIVQPHATVLMAVRRKTMDAFAYIGSDLHISQGLEVKSLKIENNHVNLQFFEHKTLCGHVDLMLPAKPKKSFHNGKDVRWKSIDTAFYRFLIDDDPGVLSVYY